MYCVHCRLMHRRVSFISGSIVHFHSIYPQIPQTLIFVSLIDSLESGRADLDVTHWWCRTCAAVYRCIGSTWSIRRTRSLAAGEIEFQLPPVREILPSPIRARMSSAVSSGPVAKGVELKWSSDK